jgi:hypothetical protein
MNNQERSTPNDAEQDGLNGEQVLAAVRVAVAKDDAEDVRGVVTDRDREISEAKAAERRAKSEKEDTEAANAATRELARTGLAPLLRGVINYRECEISQENLRANFKKLHEVAPRLLWVRPDDRKIYEFVERYVSEQGDVVQCELPESTTVIDAFERSKDVETAERCKDLARVPRRSAPRTRTRCRRP